MNASSTSVVTTSLFAKWPAVLALAFGLFIVYGAGFASPMAIHGAVHDTRHAFGLPCH